MNQHLHSPTKLTEFARDFEDDEPESFFGRFVNKIQNAYNQSYNTVNEVSSTSQTTKSTFYTETKSQTNRTSISRESSTSSINSNRPQPPHTYIQAPTAVTKDESANDPSTNSTTTSSNTEELSAVAEKIDEFAPDVNEGRTMVNVLKRISNLMGSKNSDLRNYKDTDLQRFWMPDSKAKECYDCSQKFSTFRRKHHCRLCGQIFCSKCCNQVVPGKIIMCAGDLKVCNYCSKIVLSYLKSPNIKMDLHADLQVLQQDLTTKLEEQDNDIKLNTLPPHPSVERKISVGYQEERFATHQPNSLSINDRKNILQQSNSLISLHEDMQSALPAQNCGTDLIEFLISNHKSSNKSQALAILSAMLAAGFLQPIVPDSDQLDFDENLHYKFVEIPRQQFNTNLALRDNSDSSDAPSLQFDSSGEPQPPKSIDASFSFQSVKDIELENSTTTTTKLLESYCDHEEQLLVQMLRNFNLDLHWAKVLTPLCCRAANHFKPEYASNDLIDIRNYVNFKKVPGGKRQECTIVGGVVFSKNVAHKDMATRVEHPRILLLQCPIVYERIEGKFVSLSTVLLQEKEYLRNVCARLMSFKPNVVLVHKNVAGIAQDMLRSHGITLVLDVKLSVMERLSRTLQCDILTSIESNIAEPKLGICDAFYIRNFSDGSGCIKTLMFFEKLNSPRGYSCLLRGGNNRELAQVKKVAAFLVYARYNWRLEMSFLLNEFAQPLVPKPPIFDSKETSPKDETPNAITDDEEPQLRIATPKRIIERKAEDKVLSAVSENVSDFTDPLRSVDNNSVKTSPDNSMVVELAVETRYDNRFRNALSSTLLSVSPFVTFPLPYLETEQGRKCALRPLFPTELYFSKLWSNTSTNSLNERNENMLESIKKSVDETQLNKPHPFLTLKITTPVDNRRIQSLLAEFRSFGGRYPKKKKMFKISKRRESFHRPQKVNENHIYKDALDLENHQRLPVLFCSFSHSSKTASFCAPPTLLEMKFYGQQDIMLGLFLQRYCFRSGICTLCNLPMSGHVRRYVHSMGCVQVFLSEDLTKTDPHQIYFTSWCSICGEMTPSVPLSETAKCLSFAKYLELRFHGHSYKRRTLEDTESKCQHSLHRDYVHYFSYNKMGAKFQFTSVDVLEIGLPSLAIKLQPPKPFDHFQVLEELKSFSMKGHEVFTRIHEKIADFAIEDENSPLVINLKTMLSKDQFKFKQHIEIVQTLLTDPKANSFDINDALLTSKRVLAENIESWGPRLNEIAVVQKVTAKQQQQHQQHIETGHAAVDTATLCTEELRSDNLEHSPTLPEIPKLQTSVQNENSLHSEEPCHEIDTPTASHLTVEKKSSTDQLLSFSGNLSDKKSIKKMLIHLLPSSGQINLLQSPFSSQEHYTLSLGAFPMLVHDHDLSSVIAYSLTSPDYQRLIAIFNNSTNNQATSEVLQPQSAGVTVTPSPNFRRKSQESSHDVDEYNTTPKTSHTNLNPSSASTSANHDSEERVKSKSNNSHIEIVFQDNCTQFACKIYFAKEFDLMRARTLKVPKLGKSLFKELEQSKKREELKVSQSRSGPEMELVRKGSDAGLDSINTNTKFQSDTNTIKDENTQLQTEIEECREHLARSLCSSVQWEARGGKSGSRFCKTLDDRFVLKEMSRHDITLFESFAPNYFDYINKCQQQNQPTLLAKIFGVFKVLIKTKDFFQEKSFLVMENLFYNCDIANKFDLKGSERNRLVDPTNQHGEIVLLDENLVQMSWSKPLYVLAHSKAVLKDAINRDSSFLEKNRVMDYSLLVGLDNNSGTLVLGIIDYIRTYTLDKRFESFVKQKIAGGTGKLPTVISPERYKQRFTDAMDRYFYTVPDRWEGLSKI